MHLCGEDDIIEIDYNVLLFLHFCEISSRSQLLFLYFCESSSHHWFLEYVRYIVVLATYRTILKTSRSGGAIEKVLEGASIFDEI